MDCEICSGAGRTCLKIEGVSDLMREAVQNGERSVPPASFRLRHLDWQLHATFTQVEDNTVMRLVLECLGPSTPAGEKRKSYWGVQASVRFSMKNGLPCFIRNMSFHFTDTSDTCSLDYLTLNEIQDPEKRVLGADDSITIEAYIAVGLPLGAKCELASKKTKLEVGVRKQYINDLGDLLVTGNGSDLTIAAADGLEFKVHALILKARCPDFFGRVFGDGNDKSVKIEGLESKALHDILWFIYTGELYEIIADDELLDMAQTAADFGLPKLREIVVVTLLEVITTDNALHALANPKVAAIPELSQAVRTFIKNNLDACLDATQGGYMPQSNRDTGNSNENPSSNGNAVQHGNEAGQGDGSSG